MKIRSYLIAMMICGFVLLSCKDDDDKGPACSTAWSTELQDELNAVVNAGTIWANDPSETNCVAYKASYQAYINALRPYANCSALTGQSRVEFNTALQEAEDNLQTLCD